MNVDACPAKLGRQPAAHLTATFQYFRKGLGARNISRPAPTTATSLSASHLLRNKPLAWAPSACSTCFLSSATPPNSLFWDGLSEDGIWHGDHRRCMDPKFANADTLRPSPREQPHRHVA